MISRLRYCLRQQCGGANFSSLVQVAAANNNHKRTTTTPTKPPTVFIETRSTDDEDIKEFLANHQLGLDRQHYRYYYRFDSKFDEQQQQREYPPLVDAIFRQVDGVKAVQISDDNSLLVTRKEDTPWKNIKLGLICLLCDYVESKIQ